MAHAKAGRKNSFTEPQKPNTSSEEKKKEDKRERKSKGLGMR
jgi:hypothetical protein